jgi:hypothetical protein
MKIMPPAKKVGLGARISAEEFNDLYLDKQQVLQKFKISSRTLQTWRSERIVSHCRIGRKYFYLKEEIDKLFANKVIPGKISEGIGSESDLKSTQIPSKDVEISNSIDLSSTEPGLNQPSKSFASIWNPVPPYVVPLLVVLIYLSPFAEDIIEGNQIDPYNLVLPVVITVVGCVVYWLIQLYVWISKKYNYRSHLPEKMGQDNNGISSQPKP